MRKREVFNGDFLNFLMRIAILGYGIAVGVPYDKILAIIILLSFGPYITKKKTQ